jgi:MFS family permease
VNIPSTPGAVTFFILAAIVIVLAAIPLLTTIVLDVTPQEQRGFFQGVFVALATLLGFLTPFVTGLLVQAAGRNAMQGLQSAYVLAALMILVSGVIFTTVVRPDEAIRTLKNIGSTQKEPDLHPASTQQPSTPQLTLIGCPCSHPDFLYVLMIPRHY